MVPRSPGAPNSDLYVWSFRVGPSIPTSEYACILSLEARTSNFALRTSHFELPTSNFGLRPSNFGVRTSDFDPPTSNFEPRTSNFSNFSNLELRSPKFEVRSSELHAPSPWSLLSRAPYIIIYHIIS